MPDPDIEVTDLYRRTPRKRKSKTRPFRHMTSMPPKTAPRRTQDKRPIIRSWASELSHGRNRTCGCSRLSYGEQHDYGFGRCDDHHEMDDFGLMRKAPLGRL